LEEFVDRDEEYLAWVNRYPQGFVVNAHKGVSPSNSVLHKATCNTIKTPMRTHWTTTDYKKICSVNKKELEEWCESVGDKGMRSCKFCNP